MAWLTPVLPQKWAATVRSGILLAGCGIHSAAALLPAHGSVKTDRMAEPGAQTRHLVAKLGLALKHLCVSGPTPLKVMVGNT